MASSEPLRKNVRRKAKTANNREIIMASEVEAKCREDSFAENYEEKEEQILQREEIGEDSKSLQVDACNGEASEQQNSGNEEKQSNANAAVREYASFAMQDKGEVQNIGQQTGKDENREGSLALEGTPATPKRGHYKKFAMPDKMIIGKLAAEIGNTKALRQLSPEKYPGLAESTVRSFKNLYLKEEELRKKKENPKSAKKVRGKYQNYTEEDRATIGKYAHVNGNANALRHFKESFPGLSESTVRGFKNSYGKELERLAAQERMAIEMEAITALNEGEDVPMMQEQNSGDKDYSIEVKENDVGLKDSETNTTEMAATPLEIKTLPRRKRGRPGKLTSEIEALILSYLHAIGEKDCKLLTYKAAIAITKGVIMTENRFLLSEFGGDLDIDRSWAKQFFKRHSLDEPTVKTPPSTLSEAMQNLLEHAGVEAGSQETVREFDIDAQSVTMVEGVHNQHIRIVTCDNNSILMVMPGTATDQVLDSSQQEAEQEQPASNDEGINQDQVINHDQMINSNHDQVNDVNQTHEPDQVFDVSRIVSSMTTETHNVTTADVTTRESITTNDNATSCA